MAVRLPAVFGPVVMLTVRAVAVAEVTVPTAPLLNSTVLFEAVVASKPNPLMVNVVALAARFAVLLVATGLTVATCTAAPLARLLEVTTAVRLPVVVGFVSKVTVSAVAVAAVTVPAAPRLNTTVLLDGVGSNPRPAMTIVVALGARFATLLVTRGTTAATCVAPPLFRLFVVTTAVRFPADVGLVESATLSEVGVADVTVPTAPPLKTTALFAAIKSKPNPLMISVVTPGVTCVEVVVTTGVTAATWTGTPLLTPLLVTTAEKLPAVVGVVVKLTVKDVAVAAVTVPTAPLSKMIVSLEEFVSNPRPAMMTELALAARCAVLLVTTGATVATCTADPLPAALVVTTILSGPAVVGPVVNETVSCVAVAAETVPAAPLLNVTELLPTVESKP